MFPGRQSSHPSFIGPSVVGPLTFISHDALSIISEAISVKSGTNILRLSGHC